MTTNRKVRAKTHGSSCATFHNRDDLVLTRGGRTVRNGTDLLALVKIALY